VQGGGVCAQWCKEEVCVCAVVQGGGVCVRSGARRKCVCAVVHDA
jgi:hypothetical protein